MTPGSSVSTRLCEQASITYARTSAPLNVLEPLMKST